VDEPPARGDHEPDRVLGDALGVRLGRVHDGDTPFPRGVEVDVVHADAVPADDFQARSAVHDLGVDAVGGRADDEAVELRDEGEERLPLRVGRIDDLDAGVGQRAHAGGMDFLEDEYAGHGINFRSAVATTT
jgi:hypothetical protein